jgi:sulfate adenylyltransferase subunit 1 (EFTu-like GTPase family)
MINGATFGVGDTVTLLPQGITTTIRKITAPSGTVDHGSPGLSVDLDIDADTDAGRGDMLATAPLPTVTREIDATVCWFQDKPLVKGQRLRLKHTTRSTPARVAEIVGVIDIAELRSSPATELGLNEIGLVRLETSEPLVVDDYRDNRVTGSFVLIDERNHATVAAGMVGHVAFI